MKIFGFINLFLSIKQVTVIKTGCYRHLSKKITSNSFEADSKKNFMDLDFNADYLDLYRTKAENFRLIIFSQKDPKCHKRQISKFFITISDLCYIELYFLSYIDFLCRSDLSICVEPTDLCGTDGFWELERSGLCV